MRGRLRVAAACAALALTAASMIARDADAAAPRRPATAVGAGPAPWIAWIERRAAERDTTGLAAALRGDRSRSIRAAAARALGLIQERGSLPALRSALRDRSAAVRAQAAFALGLMGDSIAARSLALRWEQEPDLQTRETIVTALGYLGAHGSASTVSRALSAKLEPERWAAALAAARLRDRSLTSPLSAHAEEARPEMRWRVAYALGRIGDPSGAPALRRLAGDKVELVRGMAARGLGDVGDSASSSLLVSLLRDPSWLVRANAARALGMLGARDRAGAVGALLSDPSAHVRWEAALALGALRDTASVALLTRTLADSSTGVTQGAALSLLRIQGESAIPTVAPQLDNLPPFLRSGLVEALGPVPGWMALEILLARSRDSTEVPEAAGAASGLAQRKADSTRVVPALRSLLGASDFTVVSSAADALGQLGDSASVPSLAALLSRFGGTREADIRASSAQALAAIHTAEALAALAGARRDPDRRVREAACAALGLPPDSTGLVRNPLLRAVSATPVPHVALVHTERGIVTIALDHAHAPGTVENFVKLARSGYFDGITFHRVVPNFVVQAGCPRGDGWGGPGYMIPCEYNDRPYETGTVGMALSGKDTGGSQWFITLSPQPRLEGRYTVFGTVTQGMAIVDRIMPGERILRVTFR